MFRPRLGVFPQIRSFKSKYSGKVNLKEKCHFDGIFSSVVVVRWLELSNLTSLGRAV